MKSIKIFISILSISIIIFSCSKDSDVATPNSNESTKRDLRDCEIIQEQLREEDRLKQTFAKFVNEALQYDPLKDYLLDHLYNESRDGDDIQNPEFLIAEHLGDNIDIGTDARFASDPGTVTTLDDIFTHWVSINDPEQLELFQNLCNDYANFVLQFPWWSIDIIEDEGGIDNANLGSIGAIEPVECNGVYIRSFFHGDDEEIINVKLPLVKHIPIYVKRSELHTKVETSPQETIDEMVDNIMIFYEDCTFSDAELLAFVKTIDCSSLQYVDYSKMATFFKKNCSSVRHHESDCCDGEDNDGDGLIDCEDTEDCPCTVEICNDGCDNDNDGHIDADDEDCQCEGEYQRDCVVEDNVLVGLKFGEAAWLNVCQLKEEPHIMVRFNFDAVQICDQSQGSHCSVAPLIDFGVEGLTSLFFEIQKIHSGHAYYDPLAVLYEDNILWMSDGGPKKYWKVFPLYVSLRKKYINNLYNQWIPAEIGDKITFTTLEEDNNSASISESITNSITTRHSFNAGQALGLSELISTTFNYTFDNTKVSSATSVTNRNFEKDVIINNYALYYQDKDEEIVDPTGVEGNTWYGQIPGNSGTGLDGLYLEFRIHD